MIGKKIKQRREELGLSQEQLAKMIGVSKSAVSNYEVNISSPKETVLFKLFDALKCDANYLYEDYIVYDENFIVTNIEKNQIKKYRQLDTHGKKMVDFTLNEEYKRCTTIVEESVSVQSNAQKQIKKSDTYNSEFAVARSSERDFLNVPDEETEATFTVIEPDPDF